jgi:hypothetical protein
MKTDELSTKEVKELHIEKINNAIDAILDLEDYYPLPSDLSSALNRLRTLRNYAEEEIEVEDKVYDTFTKKYRTVSKVSTINLYFNDEDTEHYVIGKKYCFKVS